MSDDFEAFKQARKPKIIKNASYRAERLNTLNAHEVSSIIANYLGDIMNKRLLTAEEKQIKKVFFDEHRNYTWINSRFIKVLSYFIDNKIIRITKY